jgi:hypothetical protein
MTDQSNIAEFSDEEIDKLPTKQLRELAEIALTDWMKYADVARVQMTNDVMNHPGALKAIDSFFDAMRAVYRNRELRIKNSHGTVELSVYAPDDELRQYLKTTAKRARDAAEESE